MTGVEPISRGATSQHFTIKLQPLTYTHLITKIIFSRSQLISQIDGGWIRTNETSNYEPDEITTSPLRRLRPLGLEPRTFGFEDRRSIQLSYERLSQLPAQKLTILAIYKIQLYLPTPSQYFHN